MELVTYELSVTSFFLWYLFHALIMINL